jgi:hypothetical protein
MSSFVSRFPSITPAMLWRSPMVIDQLSVANELCAASLNTSFPIELIRHASIRT